MNKNILATILIVVLITIAVFYFMANGVEAPSETDEVTTEEISDTPATNTDYVGMTTTEASARAETNNELFRVVEIDGAPQPTTKDFRPGRINAAVENNVVVSYTVEGVELAPNEPVEITPFPGSADSDNGAFIGMTTAEARAYAEANDIMFRIGAIDGEFLALTMDYRPGRVTASVVDDIIVDYSVEGSLE